MLLLAPLEAGRSAGEWVLGALGLSSPVDDAPPASEPAPDEGGWFDWLAGDEQPAPLAPVPQQGAPTPTPSGLPPWAIPAAVTAGVVGAIGVGLYLSRS